MKRFIKADAGFINLDHVSMIYIKYGDENTGCVRIMARIGNDDYDIDGCAYPVGTAYDERLHQAAINWCEDEALSIATGGLHLQEKPNTKASMYQYPWSIRASNVLNRNVLDFQTITFEKFAAKYNERIISMWRNCGTRTIDEIKRACSAMCVDLKSGEEAAQ
jgi:hypothetical protein